MLLGLEAHSRQTFHSGTRLRRSSWDLDCKTVGRMVGFRDFARVKSLDNGQSTQRRELGPGCNSGFLDWNFAIF